MYDQGNTSNLWSEQVGDAWIAPGARWRRFLLARTVASRREATWPGSIVARKWRAIQCGTAGRPAAR